MVIFRIEKSYDEFQLKLELESLENSYELNITNSNASLAIWQDSAKNRNSTPILPKSIAKRKHHEINAANGTNSANKRAKLSESDVEHEENDGDNSDDDCNAIIREDEINQKATTSAENKPVKCKPHFTRIG